jgi:hypothetical protein
MGNSQKRLVSRRSDFVLGALTLSIFILVYCVSNAENALAYSVVCGVFLSLIQAKWNSRRDGRFWVIMAIFAFLHVVILSLVHIPQLKFGLMILPFALADGFAMWGFINWIDRRFPRSGPPESLR